MDKPRLRALTLALLACCLIAAAQRPAKKAGDLSWQPYVLETAEGQKVEAELGTLVVPENRKRPDGRLLDISFVRLKSLSPRPGPPIVYLAGGPGGSGIEAARGPRYPLFAALRQVADVIAIDQRGVGMSAHILMLCRESWLHPVDRPGRRDEMIVLAQRHSRECAEFLTRNGFDISAYNNEESAEDLEDLRRALNAPRFDVWGVSYGTTLALTALRRHPESFHRAVLVGVEGPDQGLGMPSNIQALLEKVDQLVRADPGIRDAVPDFLGLVRSVLERLERQPATAEVLDPLAKRNVPVSMGRFDLQMMTAQALASTDGIRRLPGDYLAMSRGDFSLLAEFVYRRRKGWLGQAMPYLVDCSQGTPPERLAKILEEEKRTLLGRAADYPYPEICAGWGLPAPAPETWTAVRSQIPALLISGTLDGRTPARNSVEVARGLPNSVQLVIDGAGHGDDLLLSSPSISEAIVEFLKRGKPETDRIALGPFRFQPVGRSAATAPPTQRSSSSSNVP